jgi:hypothetical protein
MRTAGLYAGDPRHQPHHHGATVDPTPAPATADFREIFRLVRPRPPGHVGAAGAGHHIPHVAAHEAAGPGPDV